MVKESFRRSLRWMGSLDLKVKRPKKSEGEIMTIAKTPVATVAQTTRIYDAIKMMAKEGFRRLPVVSSGTKRLEGIITAPDIVDYLGGGQKFEIVQKRFGGNFFKAINEPVGLIMTQKVVAVLSTAKISEAISLMKEANIGGLPVVDDKNSVKGIITERDIADLFAGRFSTVRVSQIMSEKVISALPTTTIFEAGKTMASQGFRRLPITSNGKLLGIITAMDIIRFFGSGQVFRYLQSDTMMQVLNTPTLEIASKTVSTITPDADVGNAAKIMREKDIGAVPVVQNERLVGIITERDFFKIID